MMRNRLTEFVTASLLFVLLCLLAAPSRADGNKQEDVFYQRDVVYGKGGTTNLLLDLATPKAGTGPFPVVLLIHGGGWRDGSRKDLDDFAMGAARLGYVGVTIEYRLVPQAKFPAQIEDCKAAVRWIRANAAKYHADPNRIAAMGFSAGAHLSCLLGLTKPSDGLEGTGGNPGQSSAVQAVISFYGPADFTRHEWNPALEKDLLIPFFGGTLAEKPDLYRKASPLSYPAKGAPPFLIMHGAKDELVPVDQSKRLAAKLKAAGVPVEFVIFPEQGHGFHGPDENRSFLLANDFLKRQFAKLKPAR